MVRQNFREPAAVGHVRPVVAASWSRACGYRLAGERTGATVLDAAALQRSRQRHRRLVSAARPVLAHTARWLRGAGALAVLSCNQGVVLEVSGDPPALVQGERIGLAPGGQWREADIGTNAIGTALAEGAPVQIHGAEHYCVCMQGWSGVAAPIHDPDGGQLLGVFAILSAGERLQGGWLPYVVALAQQVATHWRHGCAQSQQRVLQQALGDPVRWPPERVIAVDDMGRVLFASPATRAAARAALGTLWSEEALSWMQSQAPACWAQSLAACWPQAALTLVSEQGRELGALILTPRRAAEPAGSGACAPASRADPLSAILGVSPGLRAVCEQAREMALSGAPVLIEGESGVGKELFARAMHGLAAPAGPWVPVNCGGLAPELIGSELFGYERGAFTGADPHGRAGKFEAAQGGVLCLDEIGEMPLSLQAYLLRVLEDGVVYRLGSSRARQVSLRLVSMTHRDLRQEIAAGRFRHDLFYRLAVLRLHIPPLRERVDDIDVLAEHYARQVAQRLQRTPPVFSATAWDRLRSYAWPGNVRELRNVIESLVCLAPAPVILPEHLPPGIREPSDHTPVPTAPPQDLRSLERAAIAAALRMHRGNVSRAARQLGIARSTLYCRMAHYGLRGDGGLPAA